jgi:hypothetical protein
MSTKYVQTKRSVLSGSINDSATTCTVTGFLDLAGNAITQTDIGTTGYGTFAPNTDKEEAISFTVDSNVAGLAELTIVRGLLGKAPYTTGGASFAHNSGTELILSNNPSLFNKMTAKDNDEVVTGSWEFPAPTADQSPATKLFVEEIATGGTVSQNRVVQAGTAGATVAAGDLVYFDDTDNEWKKTAGATATTLNNVLLGIAQGAGVDGGAIAGGVLTYGLDSTQTGMTPGVKLYASDTAGEISETAGTIEKVIGWSRSATQLYFDPSVGTIPTAREKNILSEIDAGNYFLPPQVVTFTSSGTWTKDAGLKYVVIEGVGGGGGAGWNNNAGSNESDVGGGGGSGGYFKKIILAAALGATETVTVGVGGGGGTDYVNTGGTGAATTFGSHATANGGIGGQQQAGGAGGTATGGDVNITGNRGETPNTDIGDNGRTYGQYTLGAPSMLGQYGKGGDADVRQGTFGTNQSGNTAIVIVTEHY